MSAIKQLSIASLLTLQLAYSTPILAAEENNTDDGSKGLPMMILGIVAKPLLDNMVNKFYNWFGQKTGVPMASPLIPADCGDNCSQNLQANNNTANTNIASNTASNNQMAFGVAVGAWVKPPRMPASEADLTQPQIWKKSSSGQGTEYTQVKLSILLTETGLVAVGAQDTGNPVQLRDTFIVGKPKDGSSQNVALFPIPSEKKIEVIRIKPTMPRESLWVYVLPCQVTNDTRGADVGDGNEDWQNLQTQLPSAPAQFQISQLPACPNASDVNWRDIYTSAKPLNMSQNDKRLYGTVNTIDNNQWYKLEIPYSTGL